MINARTPKKSSQNVDLTLERVKLVDELFPTINRDAYLYIIYKWWFWLIIFLFVFALLFLILGIVVSLSYSHKSFYAAAAGLSVFHLIGCPIGFFGDRFKIRYLIFAAHILNCIWAAAGLILITVNVFNGKSRESFDREIFFNILFPINIIISIAAMAIFFVLLNQLIVEKRPNFKPWKLKRK